MTSPSPSPPPPPPPPAPAISQAGPATQDTGASPETGAASMDQSEPQTSPSASSSASSLSSSSASLPSSFRIQLDAYSGPLDLLLYLVKRHEIELTDIPIAMLTDQYMQHLQVIQSIDVDRAGEFLVMAATLLEIKSQMLMPLVNERLRDPDAAEALDGEGLGEVEGETEAFDPRSELMHQLLAYKAYKDAAIALESRQQEWSQRFAGTGKRGKPEAKHEHQAVDGSKAGGQTGGDAEDAAVIELDMEDVNVMDLCAAFGRLLETIGTRGDHEVMYDDTPISLHAEDIRDRLLRDDVEGKGLSLGEIFEGRTNRSEMIGLFLAVLELVREFSVKVLAEPAEKIGQPHSIRLVRRADEEREALVASLDEAATDWVDPETGEMQYDWPDEDSERRAARRQRLRAKRAAEAEEDDSSFENTKNTENTEENSDFSSDSI